MLAPDQRDTLAEAAAVHVDQCLAMRILDLGHILENLGGLGIMRAERIGIGEINA